MIRLWYRKLKWDFYHDIEVNVVGAGVELTVEEGRGSHPTKSTIFARNFCFEKQAIALIETLIEAILVKRYLHKGYDVETAYNQAKEIMSNWSLDIPQ